MQSKCLFRVVDDENESPCKIVLEIFGRHGACCAKADPGGGGTGGTCPPLASLIIYSFLNNFVIFTTLVHLREALSYYVGLPVKLSSRSLRVYTTVFYPVFSNANNHELFSCAPLK